MELISVSSVLVYESRSNGVNWMHQQIHVHWSGHACAVWGLACVSKWQQARQLIFSAVKMTGRWYSDTKTKMTGRWYSDTKTKNTICRKGPHHWALLDIWNLQSIATVNALAVSTWQTLVIALFNPMFPDFQSSALWKVPRLWTFSSLVRTTCSEGECGAMVQWRWQGLVNAVRTAQ
jgi:hypothetical protein